MKYDEFIKRVRDRAGIADREEAEQTAFAVVQAIVDRLTGDEARDMLSQLPAPLKSSVTVTETVNRMTANEFVERIAGELGVPPEEARTRVQAVFDTLHEALTPGQFHDVLVQLPSGYLELLTRRSAPAGQAG
jgi:uncharacterized protein (DUF2267 family)